MNRGDMKVVVELGMDNRNVAEANDPFWFLNKFPEVQLVDNPYTAITAPCAHDGPDRRIVKHLLQIRGPVEITSPKNKISRPHGLAYTQYKTPVLQNFYGWL